ncbi:MAG: hypothetical protein HC824_06690 [Synechococcales cyanobacterium RM1_1_8]|nr:hypothetical protein [Synechococcales cyanobacterium RM1_1_8]
MTVKRLKKPSNEGLGLLLADVLILALSPAIALTLRLDGNLDWGRYGQSLGEFTLVAMLLKFAALGGLSVYRCSWKYAGAQELGRVASSIGLATVGVTLSTSGWSGGLGWGEACPARCFCSMPW